MPGKVLNTWQILIFLIPYQPYKVAIIIILILHMRNVWNGTEKSGNFPKVTQLASDSWAIWPQHSHS